MSIPLIKNSSLLMKNSNIFGNSNIIDNIHQSIIDLKLDPPKEQIKSLMYESLNYLDTDIDYNTMIELVNLIETCYLQIQDTSEELINEIYEKSQKNSNRLIALAMLLPRIDELKSYHNSNDILNDIIKQISIQIAEPKQDFIIFDLKIDEIYKANFIADILLSVKLSEDTSKSFLPYILTQKNLSQTRKMQIIQNIATTDYIIFIPENILTEKMIFNQFTQSKLSLIIPNVTKQTLFKILPFIEESFAENETWEKEFSMAILEKCAEFNIDFNLISKMNQLFDSLDNSMNPQLRYYLFKNNPSLIVFLSYQPNELEIDPSIMKEVLKIEYLPFNWLMQCLLKAEDINFFERASEIGINSFEYFKDVSCTNKKLWVHVFSVISNSKQKYSQQLLIFMSILFQNNVNTNDFFEFFDAMIFDNFPTKSFGNSFLSDLIKECRIENISFLKDNCDTLINKIIDLKTIPLYSFWKIFDSLQTDEIFANENTNPIIFSAHYFSNRNDAQNQIKTLSLNLDINKINQDVIIESLTTRDFTKLKNLDDESLSFISNVIIFLSQTEKTEIQGLTCDTALLFLALSLIYFEESGVNFLFTSKELEKILLKSCESSSKSNSKIIIESVNLLITSAKHILNPSFFPSETAFEIIDIFINQLIDNKYHADKLVLVKTILELQNEYFSNSNVQCIFDKNGIKIIKFIINNLNIIENADNLRGLAFNLEIINQNRLVSFLNETMSKSLSIEKIINIVYFLDAFCINTPKNILFNYNNLLKATNILMRKNDFNKFRSIYHFIMKNSLLKNINDMNTKILIPNINVDKLMNAILMNSQIEKQDSNFELLFYILMKDNTISMNYFTVLFEKISLNHTINEEKVLKNYSKQYQMYGLVFIKSIQRSYDLTSYNTFVRNFNHNYHLYSETSREIIDKLLDEVNLKEHEYQAFFALKYIASVFPFIFNHNPKKIFKIVLPKLDYFANLFENQNDYDLQSVKVGILAHSFLFSTLYCVEVLDSFITWVLQKIVSFNVSQILSFIYIFHSLFNTKKVKDALLASMIRNDFLDIALQLLKIDTDQSIHQIYIENIYNLITKYFTNLNKLHHKKKLVLINELSKTNIPTYHIFNNYLTIYPNELIPLKFPESNNESINNFIDYISKLNFNPSSFNDNLNNKEIDNFLLNFKKSRQYSISSYQSPETDQIKEISVCAEKHYWIYQYLVENKIFPLTLKLYNKIKETIDKISETEHSDKYYQIEVDKFFKNSFCHKELFIYLIDEIDINNSKQAIKLLQIIIENDAALDCFLKMISTFINQNMNKTELIKSLIRIIYEKREISFSAVNTIIYFALIPENRNDFDFISFLINKMSYLDDVPLSATHLIGLSLLNDYQRDLRQIIHICEVIKENYLTNIMEIIKYAFNQLQNEEPDSDDLISSFINAVPSLGTYDKSKTERFINMFIKKYENYEAEIDIIRYLFNSITPNRNDVASQEEIVFSLTKTVIVRKVKQSPNDIVLPAPTYLIENNPDFWSIYEKHRKFIDKLVKEDAKYLKEFKFLVNFPEITNFDFRLKCFNRSMQDKLDLSECNYLYIDRSNVLESTFQKLNGMTKSEWLNKVNISFNDEEGIDAGGLTKEWFTLVTKELLNPNFSLFSLTSSNSYIPNRFSSVNPGHIEYFRFAGKFIARALIQGQCVNAHFSSSFRRQILRHQVKLSDLEDIDKEVFNSMKNILEEDVEPMYMSFVVDEEEFGVQKEISLKENGENIDVTNENKHEYVNLYISYKLTKSISEQINAFCEGFNWLIPHDEICMFTQSELDLLICGVPDIDIKDFRENVQYRGYYDGHPVIEMFFKVISKWNSENLAKLLMFITGSSQVPVNGFIDYENKGNPITIIHVSDRNRLCVAHTCFNQLELPEYKNENELSTKLLMSIQECDAFGIS